MADIEQLVQLKCPAGALPNYKGRIVSWGSNVYVCSGNEFLYVFCILKKLITAVYLFPSKISHMELDTINRQLYALSTHCGIYLLEWDENGRLLQEPDSTTQKESITVHHIGPNFCCFQDPCISSFMLAWEVLVLVLQQPNGYKFKVFNRNAVQYKDQSPLPSKEFAATGKEAMASIPLQPALCCVSLWKENRVNEIPSNFLLEARLFTRLFGVDLAMLDSPIILCGFPDGRVAYFPLKNSGSLYENENSLKLLYHLEQPVVSVGATKTLAHSGSTDQTIGRSGKAACDCVLLIGQKGSLATVMSGSDQEGALCEYKKYPVKAPVCYILYCSAGVIYSNHSDLYSITIPSVEDGASACGKSSLLSSVRHNVPMIVAVSENLHTSDGTDLILLSSRGRLMLCKLNQKGRRDQRPALQNDDTANKIKELLSVIGVVSDRASRLKSAVGGKSMSLQKLNQVMSLSRQLVSGIQTSDSFQCDVTVLWTRMLQTDCITICCFLENRTDCALERGWTLCVLISSDISYSFPLPSLKSGEKTELTFPLPAHNYHSLDFPIQITFSLFYNLKNLVAESGLPADTFWAEQGICIPLQEHRVDLLQCLRFGPQANHYDRLHVTPEDVVQVFVKASSAGTNRADCSDTRSATVNTQGVNNSTLIKAQIRISVSLLAQALQNGKSGRSLCSAVLHWLLSADVVKHQNLVEVQGVTPDGKDFGLQVQEITVSDLSAAGGIPAIEIQILSSYLHVVASLHLAVISRFQILLQQDKNGCHTPDLDLGKVQQQFSPQESLLKELKTLKERLNVNEDIISSTAAKRLLHIYRELRDPGLFFI